MKEGCQIGSLLFLIKAPFDTHAGIAHKFFAGEIIAHFYLCADIQVRALEPSPHIVPYLRLGDQHPTLLAEILLAPYIQKARETQARRGAKIITTPYKRKLDRYGVMDPVRAIGDIFIEQFDIEDILVIRGMQAVVQAYQRRVIDPVSAQTCRVPVET